MYVTYLHSMGIDWIDGYIWAVCCLPLESISSNRSAKDFRRLRSQVALFVNLLFSLSPRWFRWQNMVIFHRLIDLAADYHLSGLRSLMSPFRPLQIVLTWLNTTSGFSMDWRFLRSSTATLWPWNDLPIVQTMLWSIIVSLLWSCSTDFVFMIDYCFHQSQNWVVLPKVAH